MKRLLVLLAVLLTVAGAAIATIWAAVDRPAPGFDVIGLNDAIQTAAETWPDLEAAQFAADVTVVTPDGTVLVATGDPIPDALTAARAGVVGGPVVVDGEIVATVYHADSAQLQQREATRRAAVTASLAVATAAALVAVVAIVNYVRVVRPFEALEDFATRVADGDLEAPLQMDRGNVFGAWTESFDLMRTELAASRAREQAAAESKRTVMSQISHDIRTPVASIAAAAELLAARETDPEKLARLGVIDAKAAQIEALITDLFQANESDLAAITVRPTEFASTELTAFLTNSDPDSRVRVDPIPECILVADRLRLQQVFDNIITNSVKYAGTDIDVSFTMDELLHVKISDAGPGVDAAELDSIFGRGVRGSNAVGIPGQGLGLYTCAYLMDRMGGSISVAPGPGFTISVGIPLAT